MASYRLSPTANLLRNSRLFALPAALNPPPRAVTSKTIAESSSATAQHPIRAAIESTPSALARGEWGLKRPLPAKSTTERSSTPTIRVNALDTFEHVTDFDSAGDHTMTLQKFQETHLPISLPLAAPKSTTDFVKRPHQSPFESHLDNVSASNGLQGSQVYRHSGPWLGGQSEVQFQRYLEQLRREKPKLLQKLRKQYAEKVAIQRRKEAQDKGELGNEPEQKPVEVTDQEFNAWLKALRSDKRKAGAEMTRLLDLHSLSAEIPVTMMGRKDYYEASATRLSSVQYAHSGPPRTHPSAGLAYSRSGALVYNHPSYGPQLSERPIEARCLGSKTRKRRTRRRAVLGVGGMVLEDEKDMSDDHLRGLEYLDPTIPGGGRAYVSPQRASISAKGTINLEITRAEKDVLAPYDLANYLPPRSTSISNAAHTTQRAVPRLDVSPQGTISDLLAGRPRRMQ
ncbi:hypothetical protein PISL3812_03769 [Talaromyces islandicus]|uniref:Uncharacterized protein n=1 Tax=Talaromyces islandicus TaxID=28573 RepID=A0A0U1LTP0_TALIS|nr:hypothetical protein PISL3812_03769 [Talaromyces islandicus]